MKLLNRGKLERRKLKPKRQINVLGVRVMYLMITARSLAVYASNRRIS